MYKYIRLLFRNMDSLLMPIMAGAVALSIVPLISDGLKGIESNKEMFILAGAMLAAFMGILMVKFLSGSTSSRYDDVVRYETEFLREKLKSEINKAKSPVSEKSEEALVNEIKDRISSEATDAYIEDIKRKVADSEYRLDIFERGKTTLKRIYKEIDDLGRRGTVNLVLGVITAISGVLALSFFVLSNSSSSGDISSFVMEFFPRLSIVLIIEVFSYFFLRLYKTSLSEIKYFQNEATNIEHNFVALEAAMKLGDKGLIEKCIYEFLAIDRNPLLQDGQKTREILTEESAKGEMPISPEYLVKIIQALKSNEPNK